MHIEIDATEEDGFTLDYHGDNHRMIIGDVQLELTADQLRELSAELSDYVDESL
jgi:hypothetical protein